MAKLLSIAGTLETLACIDAADLEDEPKKLHCDGISSLPGVSQITSYNFAA